MAVWVHWIQTKKINTRNINAVPIQQNSWTSLGWYHTTCKSHPSFIFTWGILGILKYSFSPWCLIQDRICLKMLMIMLMTMLMGISCEKEKENSAFLICTCISLFVLYVFILSVLHSFCSEQVRDWHLVCCYDTIP